MLVLFPPTVEFFMRKALATYKSILFPKGYTLPFRLCLWRVGLHLRMQLSGWWILKKAKWAM